MKREDEREHSCSHKRARLDTKPLTRLPEDVKEWLTIDDTLIRATRAYCAYKLSEGSETGADAFYILLLGKSL